VLCINIKNKIIAEMLLKAVY